MSRRNLVILRLILWLGLAAGLGVLVWLKIVPTGEISFRYDFTSPSYFIGKLTPVERVNVGDGEATMVSDPLYFSLLPPRRFDRAKVTVKFKNPTDFPLLEIGLLNDKIAWGYDLKPLENKVIDRLSLVWPTVNGQNGERLIERKKNYDSLDGFLKNLPPRERIALYDYVLPNDYKIADYRPNATERELTAGFRGSYQFYTYVKNEDLSYVFNFLDLNENKDDDPVTVKVFSYDRLVYEKRLNDDGSEPNGRTLSLKLAGLAEGVYRLSVIANDDIITKNILTPQGRLALINKVWLFAAGPKVLYTNGRRLGVQTLNPASLGAVKVGGKTLEVKETYKQFFTSTGGADSTEIELTRNDLIVSGDGVFAFSPEALIDPRLKTVDGNLDLKSGPVDYVLTSYRSPVPEGDWLTAEAEFDLGKAYRENGKYQFLISLPGLSAGNNGSDQVKIKEIKVELSGTSLWQKIKKILNRAN